MPATVGRRYMNADEDGDTVGLARTLQDAEQHAGSAANLQVAGEGGKVDLSGRLRSTRMRDACAGYAVDAACVGGEDPKGLEAVVIVESAATAGRRLGSKVNEHTIVCALADAVVPFVGHRPAVSVLDVAAYQTRCRPNVRSAEAWRRVRSQRCCHLHG